MNDHVRLPLDGEVLPPEPRQPFCPADSELPRDTGAAFLVALGAALGAIWTGFAWAI